MRKVILNQPERVIEFVENGILGWAEIFYDRQSQAVGVEQDGELVAGIVYHNYCHNAQSIEMSGYSTNRRWTSKDMFRFLFDYPFFQLDCRVVYGRTSEKNKRVRRIWDALGADEYIIPELRGEGVAEVITVLQRDQWLQHPLKRN